MRPVPTPADAARSTPCRNDADVLSSSATTPIAPFSCFLATEAELDSSEASPELSPRSRSYASKRSRSSSVSASDRSARRNRPASPSLSSDIDHGLSQPMTPVFTGVFGPGSAMSVPSSPAISSSVSLSEEPHSMSGSFPELSPGASPRRSPVTGDLGSPGPQLVMPSLTVPRRRPFSEAGKSLGKLKVLLAGPTGIGKTSLISAMAQSCAHIVHMDSLSPTPADDVAEVHASTRPHPWWRADMDPATYIRRRRMSSATEEILDRNLCFVDCPGSRNTAKNTRPDLAYVESRLTRLCNKPIEDSDLCTLLSNGAEPIVDVVLYLLPHSGPDATDVDTITALQGMTNVIPLLARADELSSEEVTASKDKVEEALGDSHANCFSFASPESVGESTHVFAVSSATRSDPETIDASILMSSDYLQPLVDTELSHLVGHIFSPEGSSWLRHSAALKAVSWRRHQLRSSSLQSALTCRRLPAEGALIQYGVANPYMERQYWGRIELSSWAEGLRQSLAAERLGQSHQLLGHELSRRELPLSKTHGKGRSSKSRRRAAEEPVNPNHQDPLGLLELVGQIKHGGGVTLEFISSMGVMGCIAAWFIRPELARHWDVKLPPPWCLAAC
ncbi:cell division/GTP binding protein [Purpureocillium lilacinum]|uniref:Cell division/GTP binding protein n=1 Tax=Purpureocillium lilacinum TaxID=33203 RepID=A0A179HCR3_PURLI|nr:cell division/GTP binding protein [Purpureocillium lilacinum]KAK4090094.1 hypothetical protein Purlil1_5720 [Purpureocillium lilacinum]OAQ88146.1 cell division/GTP binding protein [Purpureocillium lilacinum]PWI69937.1 hypothetical protein PCL_00081 [Purpureocillium lilacinum]